jgi:hypothetical protein
MAADEGARSRQRSGRPAWPGQVAGYAAILLALAVCTAAVWVSQPLGWWWAAAIAGFAAGLALRWRHSWLIGAGAGLLGWGGPLLTPHGWGALDGQARLVSGLMGTGGPAVPLVVTLGVGVALGGCGAWGGRSVRLLASGRAKAPTRKGDR